MSESDGWFTSTSSQSGNCVQVNLGGVIRVRDSKDPSGPVLCFTDLEWIAFLEGVRQGEFDLCRRVPAETDSAY